MYVYVYQMNVSFCTCMCIYVRKCSNLIAYMDAFVYLKKKQTKDSCDSTQGACPVTVWAKTTSFVPTPLFLHQNVFRHPKPDIPTLIMLMPNIHEGSPMINKITLIILLFNQVNNYIVRSYRDVIVVANIVTKRTTKA